MLKRTNEELATGLKAKHAYTVSVRPTAVQRAVHRAIESDQNEIAFSRLQMLRTNLLHPALLLSSESGRREGAMAFRRIVAEMHELPATRVLYSGKLQACAFLIDRLLPSGDKVVVVGATIGGLHEIASYVRAREGNGAVVTLLGSMSKRHRESVRIKFNASDSGVKVCLLSAKLAEGINLVGANHLIHLEPWWNPAGDRQALQRIHRPGQRKVCYLYRLACAGSIDETILMRQGGKDSLLKVLTSGKLPPAKSDDRALLFALDVSGTRLGGEGAGVAALAAAAIDVESVRTLDLADAAGVESVPSLECPALEGLCRVALRELPGLPTTTTDGLAAAARDGDGEDAGVRATTQTPPLLVECVVHGVLKSK